jgi:arginyl-tRNA--protein-N-Asp/Glu arginylyltransferase
MHVPTCMKPKDTSLIATPMQHKTQQTNKQTNACARRKAQQANKCKCNACKQARTGSAIYNSASQRAHRKCLAHHISSHPLHRSLECFMLHPFELRPFMLLSRTSGSISLCKVLLDGRRTLLEVEKRRHLQIPTPHIPDGPLVGLVKACEDSHQQDEIVRLAILQSMHQLVQVSTCWSC